MSDARTDADFMSAALALGRRGLGLTADNPAVGALIVRDGMVVGQGWTQPGGRPHAERMALQNAGAAAKGATLYVTLEPCSHYGRTPPCADAIRSAGIARVVSAMEDPDSRVSGKGHAMLRAAGITVDVGAGGQAALRANLGHILRVTQGRPMVTLKLAETADGYAAGDEHDPRLNITGAAANGRTHVMRAMHDAIMVGIGTVRADDPLMTVRLPGVENLKPLRVVLDTHLRLSPRSRLARSAADARVLAIAGPEAPDYSAAALADEGIEVARVASINGHIDLRAALALLAERGHSRVFSEGGPRIGAQLIASGLADEVVMITAEKPFGREGVRALSDNARAILADPTRYTLASEAQFGSDRMRTYERVL